jgi:hypothetical protein
MFDKIPGLDVEAVFGLLAASGGIARIVTGTSSDPRVSWWGEMARIIFVAMPIGVIAGHWTKAVSQSEILPYAASFTAGVISLNIVRFLLSTEGFSLIRNLIGGSKNGKP